MSDLEAAGNRFVEAIVALKTDRDSLRARLSALEAENKRFREALSEIDDVDEDARGEAESYYRSWKKCRSIAASALAGEVFGMKIKEDPTLNPGEFRLESKQITSLPQTDNQAGEDWAIYGRAESMAKSVLAGEEGKGA